MGVVVRRRWWFLLGLLLLAAALRFRGVDWDGGFALHPDERYLIGVAEATPFWGDPNRAGTDFPYGTLPLYVLRPLLALSPYADPLLAARLLSALVGLLLVAVAAAWGQALAGEDGALLSAALFTLAPFPIQQAHFYTVDPWATLFATSAMLFLRHRRWGWGGAMLGLALASKLSLGWAFLIPLVMAWRAGPRSIFRLLLGSGVALLTAEPWLLLDPFHTLHGPLVQAGMVAGRYLYPYTRQYLGTWPWLYPLWQMGLWGLGLPAALFGLLGWSMGGKAEGWHRWAAAWLATGFLATAALFVKFPRYLFPLYPAWTGWAAWFLLHLRRPCVRRGLTGMTLLATALLGLAQSSLYGEVHPWIAASRWLCGTLLPGETLAVETWDHPLPLPLPECAAETIAPHPFDPREASGRESAARAFALVLASRRNYAGAARDEEALRWYAQRLDERDVRTFARCPHIGPLALTDDPLRDAGLPQPASLASRCGTPFALRLPHLDESFRVYDAPMTFVLLP